MGRRVSYVRRRGYTYRCRRDSRGRFTRFKRVAHPRTMFGAPIWLGEKHISLYGTAMTSGGTYKARVDARGKGKELYHLIKTLKEGYVPKRRHRHVYGRVDRINDNFFEYFTYGEWTECEVES